jgi:hypothetical protein
MMQVLVGDGGSGGGFHAGQPVQQAAASSTPPEWEREHVFLYKVAPGVVASSYGVSLSRSDRDHPSAKLC